MEKEFIKKGIKKGVSIYYLPIANVVEFILDTSRSFMGNRFLDPLVVAIDNQTIYVSILQNLEGNERDVVKIVKNVLRFHTKQDFKIKILKQVVNKVDKRIECTLFIEEVG